MSAAYWVIVAYLWLVAVAVWFPREVAALFRTPPLRPFVVTWEWLHSRVKALVERLIAN